MKTLTHLFFVLTVFSFSLYSHATQTAGAKTYKTECSACHVAYPTTFLSEKSWNTLLDGLDKHFGDNAELIPEDLQSIKAFLGKNNYDKSRIKRIYHQRFDTPGTPIRVTKTVFFRAIHNEVPNRWVTQNPKVKSFSHCEACHRGASKGYFDEEGVHIPR